MAFGFDRARMKKGRANPAFPSRQKQMCSESITQLHAGIMLVVLRQVEIARIGA